MDRADPHIHADRSVTRDDARTRNLLAGTFGLVGDLPETVTTGCGQRVPYVMTSSRPPLRCGLTTCGLATPPPATRLL